jgi:hypothetical protein
VPQLDGSEVGLFSTTPTARGVLYPTHADDLRIAKIMLKSLRALFPRLASMPSISHQSHGGSMLASIRGCNVRKRDGIWERFSGIIIRICCLLHLQSRTRNLIGIACLTICCGKLGLSDSHSPSSSFPFSGCRIKKCLRLTLL